MATMNWRRAIFNGRPSLSIRDEAERLETDRAAKWLARAQRRTYSGKHRRRFRVTAQAGNQTLRYRELNTHLSNTERPPWE